MSDEQKEIEQPQEPKRFHLGMKDTLLDGMGDLPDEYKPKVEALGKSLDAVEEAIANENFPRFAQVFFEGALSGFIGAASNMLDSTKYLTQLMVMYSQDPEKAKALIPVWSAAIQNMLDLSVFAAGRALARPADHPEMAKILAEGKKLLTIWDEVKEANKGENELVLTHRFMHRMIKETHPEMLAQRESVDEIATSNPNPGEVAEEPVNDNSGDLQQ